MSHPCRDGSRTDGGHKVKATYDLTWEKDSGLHKEDEDHDLRQEGDVSEAQKHCCDCRKFSVPNTCDLPIVRGRNVIDQKGWFVINSLVDAVGASAMKKRLWIGLPTPATLAYMI